MNIDTQPGVVQNPMSFGIKRRKGVSNLKKYSASQGRLHQKLSRDAEEEDVDASDSGSSTETETQTPIQSSMGGSSSQAKEGFTWMAK